jgi:hypothetical protein
MKRARVLYLTLLLLAPHAAAAQTKADAERAWRPFFAAFREAAKRRDREALKKMMAADFFTSGGVGDDNQDGDHRDEAFAFWDEPYTRGWEALDRTLAAGVAPYTAARVRDKTLRRVAPPAANVRRLTPRMGLDWHAVFEFREDGRWYCAVFAQCCD